LILNKKIVQTKTYIIMKSAIYLLLLFSFSAYGQQADIKLWTKKAQSSSEAGDYEKALTELGIATTFKGNLDEVYILRTAVYEKYLNQVKDEKRGSELAGLAYLLNKTNPTHAIGIVQEALRLNPSSYSAALQLNDILKTAYPNFYSRQWLYEAGIAASALHPDGEKYACATYDKKMVIATIDQASKTLDFPDVVLSIAFNPTSDELAVACADNKVYIINGQGEKSVLDALHASDVNVLQYSADGKYLASGSWDKKVIIRQLDNGRNTIIDDFNGFISAIAFSANGEKIAIGDWEGVLGLYTIAGTQLWLKDAHKGATTSISFTSEEGIMGSAGWDGKLQTWNTADGALVKTLTDNVRSIFRIAYHDKFQGFFAGYYDGDLKLWSLDGKELQNYYGHKLWVNGVSFSDDGRKLLTSSTGGQLLFWDMEFFTQQEIAVDSTLLNCFDIHESGQYIATGHYDGKVRIWSRSGELLSELSGHSDELYTVKFIPGTNLVASGGTDYVLIIRDMMSGEVLHKVQTEGAVWDAAFTKNGNTGYCTSFDGKIRKFTIGDTTSVEEFLSSHGYLYGIYLSPEEDKFIVGNDDYTVSVWSSVGEELMNLTGHSGYVFDVAWSPDGRHLLSGSEDGNLILYSAEDGKRVRTLTGHGSRVYSVAFAANSELFASGGRDGDFRIWDTLGRSIQTFSTGEQIINVAFSPLEQYPVSVHNDGVLRFWKTLDKSIDQNDLPDLSREVEIYLGLNDGKEMEELGVVASVSTPGVNIEESEVYFSKTDNAQDRRYTGFALSCKAYQSPELVEKLLLQKIAVDAVDFHYAELLKILEERKLGLDRVSPGVFNIRGFIHANHALWLHLKGEDATALTHAKLAAEQNALEQVQSYLKLRLALSHYLNGDLVSAKTIITELGNSFDISDVGRTYRDVTGQAFEDWLSEMNALSLLNKELALLTDLGLDRDKSESFLQLVEMAWE
jgi:WD40 repeat protein